MPVDGYLFETRIDFGLSPLDHCHILAIYDPVVTDQETLSNTHLRHAPVTGASPSDELTLPSSLCAAEARLLSPDATASLKGAIWRSSQRPFSQNH
jgi:hypothetical protein